MKATFVKFVNSNQILLKLNKSIKFEDFVAGKTRKTKFVVSSIRHSSKWFPSETYLFAANRKGEIVNWSELHGIKNVTSHKQLLDAAGIKFAAPKAVEVLFNE